MRKYISSNYRKDKSRIIGLLNMSSSPYRVSQWIVMTKEWIVVRHAHPQVRQCTHHCTQDQPQLFGFKQIYTVCILEKKKLLRWQWFQHTNTNYVMKKKTQWMASEEMLWMVKCSTLLLPSTRLHAAVPFRLCRTKQNPDSSPPSRVEWIQYDTECQMFHLAI